MASSSRVSALALVLLGGAVVGFRCPGASPSSGGDVSVSQGGASTSASGGSTSIGGNSVGGGTECPGFGDALAVLDEPNDVKIPPIDPQDGADAFMTFALDPLADSHDVVIYTADDDSLEELQTLADISGPEIIFTPPTTGAYVAELIAHKEGCPSVRVTTRRIRSCATMWSPGNSLDLDVTNTAAAVIGSRLVAVADGVLQVADILPGGELSPWAEVLVQAQGVPLSVTGLAAAVVPAGSFQRLWFMGGQGGAGATNAVRGIADGPVGAEGILGASPPVLLQAGTALEVSGIHGGVGAFLDGRLLHIGGANANGPTGSIFATTVDADGNPQTVWEELGEIPANRHRAAGATFDGRVYIIGGIGTGAEVHGTVFAGSFTNNGDPFLEWQTLAPIPAARQGHAVTVDELHARVLVVGGIGSGEATSTVWFGPIDADGSVSGWGDLEPLPAPVTDHEAVWVDGTLHVIGGVSGAKKVSSMALDGPRGTPLCPTANIPQN